MSFFRNVASYFSFRGQACNKSHIDTQVLIAFLQLLFFLSLMWGVKEGAAMNAMAGPMELMDFDVDESRGEGSRECGRRRMRMHGKRDKIVKGRESRHLNVYHESFFKF